MITREEHEFRLRHIDQDRLLHYRRALYHVLGGDKEKVKQALAETDKPGLIDSIIKDE